MKRTWAWILGIAAVFYLIRPSQGGSSGGGSSGAVVAFSGRQGTGPFSANYIDPTTGTIFAGGALLGQATGYIATDTISPNIVQPFNTPQISSTTPGIIRAF